MHTSENQTVNEVSFFLKSLEEWDIDNFPDNKIFSVSSL